MPPLDQALLSLDGLSIGDAFGQSFFQLPSEAAQDRQLPPAPWLFTDDTEMSLSIVANLAEHGQIDQDELAQSFATHYSQDRAYGPSMHRTLARIRAGEPWQAVTADAFEGQGSYGNGAAMRAAPLGAYFAADLATAAEQAALSAAVTHSHPEAIAGTIAAALAAALATRARNTGTRPPHTAFLAAIIDRTPPSEVRSKLIRAQSIRSVSSLDFAVAVLGNGTNLSAPDTVPLALWCAAQHLDAFEQALWLAATPGGDRDTLCAIVGGTVACFVGQPGIPETWRTNREPLPPVMVGDGRPSTP